MFAFVDETGNTGKNLFDEHQPDFFTAALITKSNFDLVYRDSIRKVAARLGVGSLHGKELGIYKIEEIAATLLKVLKKADARFFIARVEKRYLLASKIFDTLFDSGENAAVPWAIYNIRPLRLILALKVALLVDLEVARQFWHALLDKNETQARNEMLKICGTLLSRVSILPDARSREIIANALKWILEHPETIHFHNDGKLARNGHMPNMVAFAGLLEGLEDLSKKWGRRVRLITHDKQSEFEFTLKHWHDMFSHASPEPIHRPGETIVIQKVVGSEFKTATDDESSGIQVIDIILWLYLQVVRGNALPPESIRLMNFAFKHAWHSNFSFEGVEQQVEDKFGEILRTELTSEQEIFARRMIAQDEQHRKDSMKRYEEDGIVPYMRPAPVQVKSANPKALARTTLLNRLQRDD